jgi:hypothetical protein
MTGAVKSQQLSKRSSLPLLSHTAMVPTSRRRASAETSDFRQLRPKRVLYGFRPSRRWYKSHRALAGASSATPGMLLRRWIGFELFLDARKFSISTNTEKPIAK